MKNLAMSLIPRLSTWVFNYLQLGIVIYILKSNRPIIDIFFLCLAFEIAILLDCFIKLGSVKTWSIVLFIGALSFYIFSVFDITFYSLIFQVLSIGICAFSLKKIRSMTNAMGRIKRVWRAFGYLCSPLFTPGTLLLATAIIGVCVFFSATASLSEKNRLIPVKYSKKQLLSYGCIMCHHWHYFSYTYIVPIVVYTVYQVPIDLTGFIFYVGWLGYYLFLSVNQSQRVFVVVGHCVSAAAVFWLIFAESLPLYLFLWLVTGVGGGVIVLLRDLVIGADEQAYEQFKMWESFGHLLGIVSFGVALTLESTLVAYLTGSIAGFTCAFLALLVGNIGEDSNDQQNQLTRNEITK